jgi:hypothetical protein
MTAKTEIRDKIRHEQIRLVLAAAWHHPIMQIKASTGNLVKQLIEFGDTEFDWGGSATIRSGTYAWQLGQTQKMLLGEFTRVQYAAVVVSVIILVYGFTTALRMDRRWRQAALLMFAGIFSNAVICGVLSEVSPRYQARVVWLVVTMSLVFAVDSIRTRMIRRPT